ncbi:MAG TPA: TA system VapC family ribonuclease toxin [Candidatus Binatia bacterium]|nr:TA system VapC family ribonuclease toxin [Candidatus Binatia bacterium]
MSDLPDSNVWLALAYDGHAHHPHACAWFADVGRRGAAFCRVTQMGLLRLLTHAAVMDADALSQRDAWAVYDALRADHRVAFLVEPHDIESHWRRITSAPRRGPKQWTDAYLAAFTMAGSLRLVSFDGGFRQMSGLHLLSLAI